MEGIQKFRNDTSGRLYGHPRIAAAASPHEKREGANFRWSSKNDKLSSSTASRPGRGIRSESTSASSPTIKLRLATPADATTISRLYNLQSQKHFRCGAGKGYRWHMNSKVGTESQEWLMESPKSITASNLVKHGTAVESLSSNPFGINTNNFLALIENSFLSIVAETCNGSDTESGGCSIVGFVATDICERTQGSSSDLYLAEPRRCNGEASDKCARSRDDSTLSCVNASAAPFRRSNSASQLNGENLSSGAAVQRADGSCIKWSRPKKMVQDMELAHEAPQAGVFWINFIFCVGWNEQQVVRSMLESIFATFSDVQRLKVRVWKGLAESHPFFLPLRAFVEKLEDPEKLESDTFFKAMSVWQCKREQLLPELTVRKAVVEDADDLMKIFNEECSTSLFRDDKYFLSDLIERKQSNSKAIVALNGSEAVGFVNVSLTVDPHKLENYKQFDLLKDAFTKGNNEVNPKGEASDLSSVLGLLKRLKEDGGRLQSLLSFDIPVKNGTRFSELAAFYSALLELSYSPGSKQLSFELFLEGLQSLMQLGFLHSHSEDINSETFHEKSKRLIQKCINLDTKTVSLIGEKVGLMLPSLILSQKKLPNTSKSSQQLQMLLYDPEECYLSTEEVEGFILVGDLIGYFEYQTEMSFEKSELEGLLLLLRIWDLAEISNYDSRLSFSALLNFCIEAMKITHDSPISTKSVEQTDSTRFGIESLETGCLALNVFFFDRKLYAQASDLLKCIFQFFPGKSFFLVTQPHSSPPFLQSQCCQVASQTNCGNALHYAHKDTLLHPPFSRLILKHDLPQILGLLWYIKDSNYSTFLVHILGFLQQCGKVTDNSVKKAAIDEVHSVGHEELKIIAKSVTKYPILGVFLQSRLFCIMQLKRLTSNEVTNFSMLYQLDQLRETSFNIQHKHACIIKLWILPHFISYDGSMFRSILRALDANVLHLSQDCALKNPWLLVVFTITSPRFLAPRFQSECGDPPPNKCSRKHGCHESAEKGQSGCGVAGGSIAPYCLSKTTLSHLMTIVPLRVVVIGASSTGLSLLLSLMRHPLLKFICMTLVDSVDDPLSARKCLAEPLLFRERLAYLRCAAFSNRVNTIKGTVVRIMREQKRVVTAEGCSLPYDYLFITTGLQDDCPNQYSLSYWSDAARSNNNRINGIFSISDPKLDQLLDETGVYIKALKWNPLSYAVIYGDTIRAFSMVEELLERKVPPEKIRMILPPKECRKQGGYVTVRRIHSDEASQLERPLRHYITEIVKSLGITLIENLTLHEIRGRRGKLKSLVFEAKLPAYELDPSSSVAKKVSSSEHARPLSAMNESATPLKYIGKNDASGSSMYLIQSRVLITAGPRSADPNIFTAVCEAGLAFNGRIVVDENYWTNDPHILSGGPIVELSESSCGNAPCRAMGKLDGWEVGESMAKSFLRFLGRTYCQPGAPPWLDHRVLIQPQETNKNGSDSPTLKFSKPSTVEAVLPGKMQFYSMKVNKFNRFKLQEKETEENLTDDERERRISLQNNACQRAEDKIIATDTLRFTHNLASAVGNYCSLSFDRIGRIKSFTYFGSEKFNMAGFVNIIGSAETFLNNLPDRFDTGTITDIAEYLNGSWCAALTLDRFEGFKDSILRKVSHLSNFSPRNNSIIVAGKAHALQEQLSSRREQLEDEVCRCLKTYLNENCRYLKYYYHPSRFRIDRNEPRTEATLENAL